MITPRDPPPGPPGWGCETGTKLWPRPIAGAGRALGSIRAGPPQPAAGRSRQV